MTSKHTPGPWAVDEDDRPGMEWNRHIVVDADPEQRICFMAHSAGSNIEMDEANARLIAAAPELLVALRGLLRSFHPVTAQDVADYNAARAAIAKAEGEAP